MFTVDAESFSWSDVLLAARLRGDWTELERTTREGLACLRRLTASGEELDAEAARDAAVRFRYAHNLVSGEELEAWLERWQLKVPEWRDYVARTLLRERWAGELGETVVRFPVSDEEVATALWTEAVCSGFLERAARRLAADAALSAAGAETPVGAREQHLARIQATAQRLRSEAAGEEEIEREVAAHGLDWLRVEAELLELPVEDVAREAALCVREDGRALAEVAAECGAEPRSVRLYLGEVEPALAPSLLSAREGELIGPVPRNGGFALLLVAAKSRPSVADPEVRRKAEELVLARAVDRALQARVRWREHL